MLSFATQQVTVVRPTRVDDGHGNQVEDWEHPASSTAVPRCSVQPGASTELLQHADSVAVRWTVYASASIDVLADDGVVYLGTRYRVDGEPMRWQSASGALDHVMFLLVDWQEH